MKEEKLVEDLSLVLMYLTAWVENEGTDYEAKRSWRSYDWNALDSLEESGLISFNRRAKSVYLTEKGVETAETLLKKIRELPQ